MQHPNSVDARRSETERQLDALQNYKNSIKQNNTLKDMEAEAFYLYTRRLLQASAQRGFVISRLEDCQAAHTDCFLPINVHPMHECTGVASKCTKESLHNGEVFLDVLSQSSKRASGQVYMCSLSGRTHVCPNDASCPCSQISEDEQYVVCQFGGNALGNPMMTHQWHSMQEAHRAGTLLKAPSTKVNSKGQVTRVQRRFNPTRSSPQELLDVAKTSGEIVRTIQSIFGERYIKYFHEQRQLNMDKHYKLTQQIMNQQQYQESERWMVALSVTNKMQVLSGKTTCIFSKSPIEMAIDPKKRHEQARYFANCIYNMLSILQNSSYSRTTIQQGNLKALIIAMLYQMGDGLERRVKYVIATGRLIHRSADEPADAETSVRTEHLKLIPAHQTLHDALPDKAFITSLGLLSRTASIQAMQTHICKSYDTLLTNCQTLEQARSFRLQSIITPLPF